MAVTTLACIAKLPSLSADQFKQRYEEHIQMVQKLFGDSFATVNKRYYNMGSWSSGNAEVTFGDQKETGYDCYTFNTFRDQQHLQDCIAKYKEHYEVIAADESTFLSRQKGPVLHMDLEETVNQA